ncbi:MAG: metallophosphoesterase [Fimbriimonadaceae bacterium]
MDENVRVLHISDLHFKGDESALTARLTLIKQSLEVDKKCLNLLVLFTGDISFSGKEIQYSSILHHFNEFLIHLQNFGYTIHFASVPGNHDVDADHSAIRTHAIAAILQQKHISETEAIEFTEAMNDYFNFTLKVNYNCQKWNNKLVDFCELNIDSQQINIISINTAVTSTKHETYGSLMFPVESLPIKTSKNITILILHHPLNWFIQPVRTKFANYMQEHCDIVLCGHEHELDEYEKSRLGLPKTMYKTALPLLDAAAEKEGFTVFDIDLSKRKVSSVNFSFEGDIIQEMSKSSFDISFENRSESNLGITEEFIEEMEKMNVPIQHPSGQRLTHSSIFVYPKLREVSKNRSTGNHRGSQSIEGAPIIDGSLLVDRVILERYVAIIGDSICGKTSLCYQLIRDLLERGLFPIYIDLSQTKTGDVNDLVNRAISNIYGNDKVGQYTQLSYDKKVLIIDGVDVSMATIELLRDFQVVGEEQFSAYVIVCSELAVLGDVWLQDQSLNLWKYKKYSMSGGMSREKRLELIRQWVSHDVKLSTDERHGKHVQYDKQINNVLAQNGIPAYPIMIIMMLENLEKSNELDKATGALGFHYRQIVSTALGSGQRELLQRRNASVSEDILTCVLGEIAIHMHVEEVSSVTRDTIFACIESVEEHHGFDVSRLDVLDTLVASGLLKVRGTTLFFFAFQYSQEYSLAFALHKRHSMGYDPSYIQLLESFIDTIYEKESASVLMLYMFLSYDVDVLDKIIVVADRLFADCVPCKFEADKQGAFRSDFVSATLPNNNVEANLESSGVSGNVEYNSDKYTVEQTTIGEAIERTKEISRALETLQVLGQAARSYPAGLMKGDRVRALESCYRLGLRTLTRFMELVKQSEEDVNRYFERIAEGQVSREQIENYLQVVRSQMAMFIQFGAFAIVKRVSRSIGSSYLKARYKEINLPESEVGVLLINQALELEVFQILDVDLLGKWYKQLFKEKCYVASGVICQLVWEFLFYYPVHPDDRTSLLRHLNMKEHPRMIGRHLNKELPAPKSVKRRGRRR